MLQPKGLKVQKSPTFSHADAQTIVQVLANQPLQNMAAADSVRGLLERFVLFTAKHLGPTPAAAPAAAPAPKAKGK